MSYREKYPNHVGSRRPNGDLEMLVTSDHPGGNVAVNSMWLRALLAAPLADGRRRIVVAHNPASGYRQEMDASEVAQINEQGQGENAFRVMSKATKGLIVSAPPGLF